MTVKEEKVLEKIQAKQAKLLKKVAKALVKAGLGELPKRLLPFAKAGVRARGICGPEGEPVPVKLALPEGWAIESINALLTCTDFSNASGLVWHLTVLAQAVERMK